jgi:hypothetical protein
MMHVPAPAAASAPGGGSIAGAAAAQARAMTGPAGSPPQGPALHPVYTADSVPLDQPLHPMTSADTAAPPLSSTEPPAIGPATLKTVSLSSNDPPLSVILELSGPVHFDKNLESNSAGAIATVLLKDVTPDSALQTHLVFDKSIFKDCSISSSSSGTTVTLNTQPVAHFAVVPLDAPPRLLMTFTPQAAGQKTSAAR